MLVCRVRVEHHGGHIGDCHAGAYPVDPHACMTELAGKTLRQIDYRGLGSGVKRISRLAAEPRDGGHIDYGALTLDEVRQGGAYEVENTGKIDADHVVPVRIWLVEKAAHS